MIDAQWAMACIGVSTVIAYVCRIGGMDWRKDGVPLAATNVAFGCAAVWSVLKASEGPDSFDVAALCMSVLWIVVSYPSAVESAAGYSAAQQAKG